MSQKISRYVDLSDDTKAPSFVLVDAAGVIINPSSGLPPALGQQAAADSTSVVLATGSALTDRSVTIAAGGTRQQAAAAITTRRFLFIENPINETERAWYSLITTAVADSPSISLEPGQSVTYEGSFIPTGPVDVLAATTGHQITVWEG